MLPLGKPCRCDKTGQLSGHRQFFGVGNAIYPDGFLAHDPSGEQAEETGSRTCRDDDICPGPENETERREEATDRHPQIIPVAIRKAISVRD